MYRLSFCSFSFARVLMALAVFFCHVFSSFNDFGFLFVGVFFFMSGYGLEYSGKRFDSLRRLIPYILLFVWFSFIYLFFFNVFPYPSSWFLVVYFSVMVLYRLIPNIYFLIASFFCLALFFAVFDFGWGWSASFGAFLWGVLFGRCPRLFSFRFTLLFLPMLLAVPFGVSIGLWGIAPLFAWCVFSVSSLRVFRPLAFLGRYTFFFYCVHCFFLGLFGVTWTLGGSPEFWGVLLAFGFSCFFSLFFKDYLFSYPRVKT